MAKVFYIDVAKCSGCYNCQFACKDEHCGNEWPPYAKAQPMIGQFWIRVNEYVRGKRPNVRIHYIPTLCNHCDRSACLAAAKDGAVYRREDGLVIIDPEKAAGQKQIAAACPYGAIFWNEELQLPQKCTGCAHLLEIGRPPRCVDVCPTGALQFGEREELEEQLRGASVMKPETGQGPSVYYRNIPGQFIAGTLYDPIEEEVIVGARCHLSDGAKVWDVYTDDFGDFWFKDLPVGKFDLRVEAKGFAPKVWIGLDTAECVSLGDVPLEKV